jgi:hypothetical protein
MATDASVMANQQKDVQSSSQFATLRAGQPNDYG